MGAHFGAHLLAPCLPFFMCLPGEHLPAHLAAPHLAISVLGAHLAEPFISWAAAGNARVAAVRAAREATFNDVFMMVPWL